MISSGSEQAFLSPASKRQLCGQSWHYQIVLECPLLLKQPCIACVSLLKQLRNGEAEFFETVCPRISLIGHHRHASAPAGN